MSSCWTVCAPRSISPSATLGNRSHPSPSRARQPSITRSSDIAAVQTPTQTTTVVLTYQLEPTDDTFLEAFRDDEILGGRDKLKVDATPGGVPTKVAQLQFALAVSLDEWFVCGAACNCVGRICAVLSQYVCVVLLSRNAAC